MPQSKKGISPLRYPGGKSRALERIMPLIQKFDEYREPMVGGASVFFAVRQKFGKKKKYWINDKNKELYLFWKYCKEEPKALVSEIRRLKKKYKQGEELYRYLLSNKDKFTELQRAVRFFILNRISYSGLVESGGYSQLSFEKRFTKSSIKRIYKASKLLQGVKITNLDYFKLLRGTVKDTFIFLDPPYMSKTEAKLYGKNGKFHTGFNHKQLYEYMVKCRHKWLITYDDCQGIQDIYKFAKSMGWNVKEWNLQYGTNNVKGNPEARIGKELFISNY